MDLYSKEASSFDLSMKMANMLFRFVMAFLVLTSLESHGADRALIMTIGEYRSSPLPGATLDEGNVRQILGRLGFPEASVKTLKDAQLTAKGVEKALADLAASTENGDRLFVHFSGHGSSQLINGRCEQALVGYDMRPVSSSVVADMLKQLRDKAAQVIVTIDACHSGGVVEAAGSRGGIKKKRFAPRYHEIAEGTACDQPANVIQDTLSSGLRSSSGTVVTKNYVFVAAARSDEVAYDDAERGGMATVSLMDCLNGSVSDTDKSGGISVGELAQCAQKRIDREFESDPVYRPHHLTLSGNAGIPLPISVVAPMEPERALSGSTAPRQFVASGLLNSSAAANPVATLTDLLNGSDSRWEVKIGAQPPRAKIGKDAYSLTVTSSQTGYLYLLYVGSDRKEFLQLYPADNEKNQIMPNTPLRIPGKFAAQGPAGINHLLAVVSNTPRDFSQVLKDQAAPATLAIAAALQDVNCVTRNLKRIECAGTESKSRNVKRVLIQAPVAQGQADSFGAAMIELIEE